MEMETTNEMNFSNRLDLTGVTNTVANIKAEIRKIYAAIGFNDTTLQYRENYQQKPIEWNKVHNLPDHVYFNHSQHVKVGGIDCATCHGKMDTLTVKIHNYDEQTHSLIVSFSTDAIELSVDHFGHIIDPFGGLEDLQNKILKTPLQKKKTENTLYYFTRENHFRKIQRSAIGRTQKLTGSSHNGHE